MSKRDLFEELKLGLEDAHKFEQEKMTLKTVTVEKKERKILTAESSATVPVILEIKHLYIDDKIITDKEKISFELDSIARVGRSYRALGDTLEAPTLPQ